MATNKKYKAVFVSSNQDVGGLPDESITLVCDDVPGAAIVKEIENELEGI